MDLATDKIAECFHIHYIPRFLIRFSYHFYFQFIIMTMVMGQRTFTKHLIILYIIPMGVEKAMSGVKMFFSIYSDLLTHMIMLQKNVNAQGTAECECINSNKSGKLA